MAEDLDTPVAPSGPEASTVDGILVNPSTTPEGTGNHPSSPRFRSIVVVLCIIGGVALLLAGGLAASKVHSGSDTAWSDWSPTKSGAAGAQEIANHVAPSYKGSNGQQLVSVTGGEVKVADLPVRIALRNTGGTGDIKLVSGTGILYTMCGLGAHCAIAAGKASLQRMLLLRREALELALYTFKSDSSVDHVAVLMPPRPGERQIKDSSGTTRVAGNQGTAMLITRDSVKTALANPLSAIIPAQTPSVDTIAKSPEAAAVNALTGPDLFMMSIIEGQDATAYLVLDPIKN
ncbi:MAG: hypothetical protein F2799_00225 [Actinobacteria bacterium]|uniref:Unannotated protein n=1 Tax=freshwater metagenome TaxID=449393 RepID=A0A6J7CNQ3_9ZZZZ|nr:hypothetical protein [Actinomycetota bacterium]